MNENIVALLKLIFLGIPMSVVLIRIFYVNFIVPYKLEKTRKLFSTFDVKRVQKEIRKEQRKNGNRKRNKKMGMNK